MDDWDYAVDLDAALDPSGYDSLPVDIFENDYYVAPEDWSFGLADYYDQLPLETIQDFNIPLVIAGDRGGYQDTEFGDLMAAMAAQQGGAPQFSEAQLNAELMRGDTRYGGAETSSGSEDRSWWKSIFGNEPKSLQERSGLSSDVFSKLSPSEQALLAARLGGQQQEVPTWQRLLQLGLTGAGGLASYNAAKRTNTAAQQAAEQNQANIQGALSNYAAAMQRPKQFSLSGGYAALTPAETRFRPLAR